MGKGGRPLRTKTVTIAEPADLEPWRRAGTSRSEWLDALTRVTRAHVRADATAGRVIDATEVIDNEGARIALDNADLARRLYIDVLAGDARAVAAAKLLPDR